MSYVDDDKFYCSHYYIRYITCVVILQNRDVTSDEKTHTHIYNTLREIGAKILNLLQTVMISSSVVL